MHNKYIITYECHDNALRMWKVVQLKKYFDFSLYSHHFSLLSLTSPLSAPEREVTSPSDFKVVGALLHIMFWFGRVVPSKRRNRILYLHVIYPGDLKCGFPLHVLLKKYVQNLVLVYIGTVWIAKTIFNKQNTLTKCQC